jgi:phenylalanyl-tRNA synthetase alpha chain
LVWLQKVSSPTSSPFKPAILFLHPKLFPILTFIIMNITIAPINKKSLKRYLAVEEHIQSSEKHAVKLLYTDIKKYIEKTHSKSKILVYHLDPIVSVEDNYDRLLIPKNSLSRSSTYTHYVNKKEVLRTHTSAGIPTILKQLSKSNDWEDVIILLPGLVYRRDVTDKIHLGVCQQLDIWRIVRSKKQAVEKKDLLAVIRGISNVAIPHWKLRIVDSPHPYTRGGIEVNAVKGTSDIEILESGVINDQILRNAELDPTVCSGWAMGMGLDRLVMARKDIPDIRYLRSTNPLISSQIKNLEPYHEVSHQPAIIRDMSYCVPQDYAEEDIHEDIREALGTSMDILESILVLSVTNYKDLPQKIKDRLGCAPDQKNVLVRITLRHLSKTLTHKEANKLYNKIYSKVNYGKGGYQ